MFTMFRLVMILLVAIPVCSANLRNDMKRLTERLYVVEKSQFLDYDHHNAQIQQILDALAELNSTTIDGKQGDFDLDKTHAEKESMGLVGGVTRLEQETNAISRQLGAIYRGIQQEKKLRKRAAEETDGYRAALHAHTERLIEVVNNTALETTQTLAVEVERLAEFINDTQIQHGQQCIGEFGARLDEAHERENHLKSELTEIKETLQFLKYKVQCPSHWVWLKATNACYKLFESKKTYVAAVAACTALNSHVTDVSSDVENNFLATLVTDDETWIGLTDEDDEGVWRWQHDNTVTAYTKWRADPRQPNNIITQNCVIINWDQKPDKHLWHDWVCTRTKPFICKMSL